jgi:hypothetical protein
MELVPWQQVVLDTLRELSDASFQERVWIRGEGDENSSPIEVVNQLFDDSGLSDLLDRGTVFSERADGMLKELSAYIDTIDFERSAGALLADERWQELRQLAAQTRREVIKVLDRL